MLPGKVNVILYDEKEMKCYGGYLGNFKVENPIPFDVTALSDTCRQIIKMPQTTANAILDLRYQIAELDPTTMKRIARFNLEKENEELLEEIERNKKAIESLKSEYKELEKRLEIISKIGKDIWENGTEYEKENDYYEDDY